MAAEVLRPGCAPLFPDTGAFLFATFGMERGLWSTAGVQQAPDVGELGVACAAEQVLQVDFQKTGAGERGGVAQQA